MNEARVSVLHEFTATGMTYPRVHVDTVVVVYIGFVLNVVSSTCYQELELKICIQ